MKKTKKECWKERITDRLELPKDLLLDHAVIYMIGQQELYITNYRGIVCYTEEYIRLNIRNGQLEIAGKKLLIEDYSEHSMKITGCVQKICYL